MNWESYENEGGIQVFKDKNGCWIAVDPDHKHWSAFNSKGEALKFLMRSKDWQKGYYWGKEWDDQSEDDPIEKPRELSQNEVAKIIAKGVLAKLTPRKV